ncbi:hypothetical protein CRN41_04820 [Vibrio vulnificus]|nr:hypothetical protein CRN41_04820 [Vibrio vulnificus]
MLEKRRHRRESNTNAEREQREFFKSPKRRKAAIKATFLCMVPVGGLEPPLPKETDFKFFTWPFNHLYLLGFYWTLKTMIWDLIRSL